ncbi:uncharacterized protein I303_103326 [Kwoniella dejecticola CBS 10117]|uniref:Alpha-L-rhamnosidase n=1 Tax=Kwoniella dejecticola CBS 10117 TaxID=1296121 RepID=A0A1A6A6F5_9TREE|nr:alpha-L-rhamnosidase [Kwoniella dejecticola CBS 10117]OBR85638.1 alpha-L-rhamnosidase [Kwoniella dejecticola CBS 10117]
MVTAEVQRTINALQANWVWVPQWVDSSTENTAARLVSFTRTVKLDARPREATLHFSADTRYKLFVNGQRVSVGPSKGHSTIWYYDTLDIAPWLKVGENKLEFLVIRYFAGSRGGMPFERTTFPGFTCIGRIGNEDVNSAQGWDVVVDESRRYPTGLQDDVFLHINERVSPQPTPKSVKPVPYAFKTLNGELPPWRLQPRCIPLPESTAVSVNTINALKSTASDDVWREYLSGKGSVTLGENTRHSLDIQADVHSTAFVQWSFSAKEDTQIKLKLTYSEGYELEPRFYPWLRTKANRLDSKNGLLLGPYDEVTLDIPAGQTITYEPFWFRTFRLIRFEVEVGKQPVQLVSFKATQVNYPLDVKGDWREAGDEYSERIWDVSIRTLRNCMFDGYSDCPFYEQLQYSGDSRSVGLFHYLISGDDRLMRQAIINYAASITPEGLTQSRFPSHVPQIIAAFSLYWILQVCDHHLYFGDTAFTKSFIPRIDGVFEFFDQHIDELGLVSGISEDIWQYCDWVTTWSATDDHPDKGVPTSGRKTNRHTYLSLLYAYVLQKASALLKQVGRPGNSLEYAERSSSLRQAIKKHCYDGQYFTDSTVDVADDLSYSQHCQVFAVLADVPMSQEDRVRILKGSFGDKKFSKCSYVMIFYALRAFAIAGDEPYEEYYKTVFEPWKRMLDNGLTTWEEDDVRQRSDCHAWGSVPIYEYCTEVAGIQPLEPAFKKILFKPRINLSDKLAVKVALGKENLATVSWKKEGEKKRVNLKLEKEVEVVSQLRGEKAVEQGKVTELSFLV